jgi:hypothetical protein
MGKTFVFYTLSTGSGHTHAPGALSYGIKRPEPEPEHLVAKLPMLTKRGCGPTLAHASSRRRA